MNRLFIYIICVVAAMLPLCGCSSSDEPSPDDANLAAVHGSVVIDGEPVNAAAILLTPGGGVKITGSDGLYNFTGLTPGKYELKVFKEGCQTQNSSIELTAGRNEELVFTLAKSVGGLSINKNYIDMGSNESNNVAGFTIKNSSNTAIDWKSTNAARWITTVEPSSGTVPAGSSQAVSVTIDRKQLSSSTMDNYATLLIQSVSAGDGSIAELLVTVFGSGNGTNTINDNSSADYVMVGDLYVQTKDLSSEAGLNFNSAELLCENSIVGGFDDWRLPTIEELALLYNNKEAIGGFASAIYWGSRGYGLDFTTGNQGSSYGTNNLFRVRAVRKDEQPEFETRPVIVIDKTTALFNGYIENAGNPPYIERGFAYSSETTVPTIEDAKVITPGNGTKEYSATVYGLKENTTYFVRAYVTTLEETYYGNTESIILTEPDYIVLVEERFMVQKYDISDGTMAYSTAAYACNSSILGGFDDWRLPTVSELNAFYRKKEQIGNFKDGVYWSKDSYVSNYKYGVNFVTGDVLSVSVLYSDCYVRAVRPF